MSTIKFRAYGTPITEGSMVQNRVRGMRHADKKLLRWRTEVGFACQREMARSGLSIAGKNVRFRAKLTFIFDDSKSFQTGRNDLDKLQRAVFDAVSGVLYPDDSCVFDVQATKELGDEPGVVAVFTEINDDPPSKPYPGSVIKDCDIEF